MRHDESNKAEHACSTDSGCGEQRGKHEEDKAGACDIHAEAACRLLAELQGVQPATAEQRSGNADECVGEYHLRMAPAAPREPSCHPVHRALHAIGVEYHQCSHRSAEKCGDGDTCEYHAHWVYAVFP